MINLKSQAAPLGANLLGALNGAVSCIATTLAAATLVFAPLGPAYLPFAVLACLVGAIAGGLIAAALASTPVAISSPRTAQCVVLAAMVSALSRDVAIPAPQFIIALTCVATLLAGFMQIAGGIFRVGQLVRFVPYPVIAGFTHGISVILFVVYIPMVLGTSAVPRLEWPNLRAIVPASMIVGGVTIAVAMTMLHRWPKWPAFFIGMGAGVVVHAMLARWAPGLSTGAAVLDMGSLPLRLEPPADWGNLIGAATDPTMWSHVSSFAVALAVVASVDGLLSVAMLEMRYGVRSRPDRDLVGQGVANMASAGLGGVSVAYSFAQADSAYLGGARDRLASFVAPFGVLALAAAAVYTGVGIPLAALAGLMLLMAARITDPWAFGVIRTAWQTRGNMDSAVKQSLAIYALVALSVMLLGVIPALAIGVTASMIMFLRTMNRQVVRRVWTGVALRSRRLFQPVVAQVLARRMQEVAVMELQGPLFFGTSDRIVEEVGRLPTKTRFVVLDLARVQALDQTAVEVVLRVAAKLRSEKRALILSGRPPGLLAVAGSLPPSFPDRDRAVEWIEERFLSEATMPVPPAVVPPSAFARLLKFDENGAEVLERHCPIVEFTSGSTIFRAGDASKELYFLLSGRVTIILGEMRVVTFLAGNMFGDVAFIDGEPRSADALCDADSRVMVLDRETLAKIEAEAPELKGRVFAALALEIAARLRATDRMMREIL
ncbi:MAG TPA: SulP family inorganic anion transporter [Usitatibacter sp.]|nr:SulP family inorganic anion transporter [Usitatibacter sp.]